MIDEQELTQEALRQWAHAVAGQAAAKPGPGAEPGLIASLPAQEAQIQAAVAYFQAAPGQQALSHAAEWLLDNFYLAQQSLRQIDKDLPAGFYRQLPKLKTGEFAGYPRVYSIVQELIAASNARLDMQQISHFVTFYQEIQPLTTGELWALPIMLRYSILAQMALAAEQLTPKSAQAAAPAALPPTLPLAGKPGADEVVAGCFASLRAILTQDWRSFFESVSRVERILRTDPAGVYASMDRQTRDHYRKIVEELALAAKKNEWDVAAAAITLAETAAAPRPTALPGYQSIAAAVNGHDAVTWITDVSANNRLATHVGYYLLGSGREALEKALGRRLSPLARLKRWAGQHPTFIYIGPILLLTIALTVGAVAFAEQQGGSLNQIVIAGLLAVLPMFAVAVAVVDWLFSLVLRPRILPKLDFTQGEIPEAYRTLIVVPALLTGAAEVASLLRQIEQHSLRNQGNNLYFGLLTDFADAPQKEMPGDAALLEQARAGIAALNERYSPETQVNRFCLFHRRRLWNEQEGAWIGWERKRGKLNELNRWLRSDTGTSFTTILASSEELRKVKYVITLDADTILGSEGARRLIGALAHPLNQARSDPATGQVVEGYGLLQPRTEITPTSANYSRFTRIFAGDIGLDLYTHAVSNLYQDLFGSGIFIGKGIYDVDAFETSLAGRVPENALLSHDLFEGIHGRVGLVTDIVVYEDYPPTYAAYMRRQHRWTRGDWQLLPWLLPWLPGIQSAEVRTGFHVIDDWKIVDNLRRSLLAPSLLLLLLAGWLLLPGPAWVWTLAALAAFAVPTLIGALTPWVTRLTAPSATTSPLSSGRQSLRSLREGGMRWLLGVVFLPYEALQMLDAISTSVARVFFVHRNLLEWMTAAKAARFDQGGRERTWRHMISTPAIAVAVALLVLWLRPYNLIVALPLLLAWAAAPEVAYRIGQPIRRAPAPLTAQQRRALHSLARRTWLFFEEYVGPNDHWLPPDHYQESLHGSASPYTSPTNIGLLLLSTLSAYDLGYIGVLSYVTRLRSTFDSLGQLERYRGHFLNWYDTRTLEPLPPSYVSTVDSGNLAACLRIVSQSCRQIPQAYVLRWARWNGLADSFTLLDDFALSLEAANNTAAAAELRALTDELCAELLAAHDDPRRWLPALDALANHGWKRLEAMLMRLVEENTAVVDTMALSRLRIATHHISNDLYVLQRMVHLLLPWLPMIEDAPALFTQAGAAGALSGSSRISETYAALAAQLPANSTLADLPALCVAARHSLAHLAGEVEQLAKQGDAADQIQTAQEWCELLDERLEAARQFGQDMADGLADIDQMAERYFQEMDFAFLFDEQRKIFHIGYNVTAAVADNSFYDLLASEARIASLVALAKHEVPRSHWLHLSRPLTQVDGARVLLSWSATMFEYLMPTLLMRSYTGTLLHESAAAAVDVQIEYGRSKGVPWGISESGYYAYDSSQNYQYRAFGVPGLGFKRNLAEDLVIAPYASLLALPFQPQAVVTNLEEFIRLGALGTYGLYEAVDFTPARLPAGQKHALVQEYMAHHQGMILVALDNYLAVPPATTQRDLLTEGARLEQAKIEPTNLMVKRFHADPLLDSQAVLLQERVPEDVPLEFPQPGELAPVRRIAPVVSATPWQPPVSDSPGPQIHYLSNSRYSLLLTAAGGGVSRWHNFELTRWRPDSTLDNWGCWVYIQDCESGALWSAAQQPVDARAASQTVRFYAHKAEFHRIDNAIAVTMEVGIAPDHDVEMRRVTLQNHDDRPRRLSVTSYGEVVMAVAGGDERHPAFNKLFIESEPLPDAQGLLFRRRPRSADEPVVLLAHLVIGSGKIPPQEHSLESDRARFVGRGGSLRAPAALADGWSAAQHENGGSQLSGTVGATLDPIFSLQRELELQPGESGQIVFLTLAAGSQSKLLDTASQYTTLLAVEHGFAQARSRAELELRQAGLSTLELERYQTLLSALLYPVANLRANRNTLAANRRGQPNLWSFDISGDYPILLVTIEDKDGLGLVEELLQAHIYWRRRGLLIDLVILNEQPAGYNQEMRDQLQRLLAHMQSETWLNRRGGIFFLNKGQLQPEERTLLASTARVVLSAGQHSLATQLEPLLRQPQPLPAFSPEYTEVVSRPAAQPLPRPAGLAFDNGLGGFSDDGREYVMYLQAGQLPPAPWANVIANAQFGCIVSESGGGYTWAANSGENRLTPWANDPVIDQPGEVLYLRDEETAEIWSPTPQPCGAETATMVQHGAGYSIFTSRSHGLNQQLRLYIDPDAPVKIVRLRLDNQSDQPRRITATFYAEWVLGVNREQEAPFIIPEFDDSSQALLARNPWHPEFGERVAFAAASRRLHGLTADRREFLGRLGSMAQPAALRRIGLSGTVEPGSDPCAALQVHIDLPAGGSDEVWFLLGQGANREEAVSLAHRFQQAEAVDQAWQATHTLWEELLGAVQVRTPDPAMNLMLNRWLLYQSLSCRIWGRSAVYQSSGAFGFRDQLQDVMAMVHTAPALARQQILYAAGRQFETGDVLHWWHPPSGRGVRTRCSDDLLWLPYVTAHYIEATGDLAILDERISFLQGPPLAAGEDDRYGEYPSTSALSSLYEHCRRAIRRGATAGEHALPLIGSGDWNDGMNRVGVEGRGESIWLGWFLHATLTRFAAVCDQRADQEQAEQYRQKAGSLVRALEQNAWDGGWYLRAFYDDGEPLGSAQNRECQIDAIAQSWAVLSGAGDLERSRQAMQAVLQRLAREEDGLLLLFTPPFDKTAHDPGYIKGYLPGIRENGGQYTHAATWSVWAFAELGQADNAERLFRMLNPIYHADSAEKVARYRVEPYVVAADIYGVAPHIGRGGWTWYTGSAAWLYRLGLEGLLGLRRSGAALTIKPNLPAHWPGYEIDYRYGQATYHIRVRSGNGGGAEALLRVDGIAVEGKQVSLHDDGQEHNVDVLIVREPVNAV